MKTISQNPDRYSKVGSSWVISADKAITPITLPIGVQLTNLKPLIKVDGIIVKLDEDYLCSLNTLNLIKDSNNPHYDIIQNGMIMVRDKEVIVGSTIKIIELNLNSLNDIMDSRDTLNLNAGAIDVLYGPETELVDGVPKGLIDQINYTLDKVSERPKDEYSIFDFYSMVDWNNNTKAEHYKITPLLVATQQADTIFDPTKLKTYLQTVAEKLQLLEDDFNLIQDIFYEAKIPANALPYTETQQATPDTDTNKNHTIRRFYRSTIGFQDTPLGQTNSALNTKVSETEVKLTKALNEIDKLKKINK